MLPKLARYTGEGLHNPSLALRANVVCLTAYPGEPRQCRRKRAQEGQRTAHPSWSHGPVGHELRETQTALEMAPPVCLVNPAQLGQFGIAPTPMLPPNQMTAQNPGRLHSHANSFRDDGMRFSRRIAG